MSYRDNSLFEDEYKEKFINEKLSKYSYMGGSTYEELKLFYDNINNDKDHMENRDDICTPMECVKKMIDYIPNEFWSKRNISIFDPCCGNGNFGSYCSLKTDSGNIYYNDINYNRICNCKKILNLEHISFQDAFDLKGDFNRKYNLIVANPPYSGGGNKNVSLSNKFIELAIDYLEDRGYICYVTPNNWMTYNNNNTTLYRLLNEGSF